MSGITPLLDTLLPQILAKRVDTPLPANLNAAVGPVVAAPPERPLRSDARLNASATLTSSTLAASEQPLAASSALRSGGGHQVAGRENPAATARDTGVPTTQSPSESSSLSPTARLLAAAYSRGSDLPARVALPAPLFSSPLVVSSPQLAASLGRSIRDSGLFYESHLAGWYRGQVSREQLEQEPQMKLMLAARDHGLVQQLSPPHPPLRGAIPAPSPTTVAPGRSAEAVEEPLSPETVRHRDQGVLPVEGRDSRDSLQAIVQQQMALLASPLLHWHGEVWPGALLAMLIQPPGDWQQRQGENSADEAAEFGRDSPWHLELALDLPSLGRVKMKLSLLRGELDIALQVDSESGRRSLDREKDKLLAQLQGCGFSRTGLNVQGAGGDHGG